MLLEIAPPINMTNAFIELDNTVTILHLPEDSTTKHHTPQLAAKWEIDNETAQILMCWETLYQSNS